MLELLTQILHFFWDLVPRPVVVGPTEEAASFFLGRRDWGKLKKSGVYIVWPMIQSWRQRCVVSQVCETAIVSVSDAQHNKWQWRLGIEYDISDLLLYETSQYSGQNHLEMLGAAALVRIMARLTSDEVRQSGVGEICGLVTEMIAGDAAKRGMKVLGVEPIMSSRCQSIFVSQAERLVD